MVERRCEPNSLVGFRPDPDRARFGDLAKGFNSSPARRTLPLRGRVRIEECSLVPVPGGGSAEGSNLVSRQLERPTRGVACNGRRSDWSFVESVTSAGPLPRRTSRHVVRRALTSGDPSKRERVATSRKGRAGAHRRREDGSGFAGEFRRSLLKLADGEGLRHVGVVHPVTARESRGQRSKLRS